MTRLAYYSDLHLEKSGIDLVLGDSRVVAVVGDVMAPLIGQRLNNPEDEHEAVWWLRRNVPEDRPVLFVPGNHDYEGTRVLDALAALRRTAEGSHVHILWNQALTINGVRYIGSPLWADPTQGRHNPQDVREAVELQTDLRRARKEDGTPLDVDWLIAEHRKARAFIDKELTNHQHMPTVVLTHWAPSLRSQGLQYQQSQVSGYWSTDCEDLVARAHLWIHGHIHDTVDYHVGEDPERGWVTSNPRGSSTFFNLAQNLAFDPGGRQRDIVGRARIAI